MDLRKQFLYVGIGLNLSKLLRPYLDVPVFNYFQMPYTYLPVTYQISRRRNFLTKRFRSTKIMGSSHMGNHPSGGHEPEAQMKAA